MILRFLTVLTIILSAVWFTPAALANGMGNDVPMFRANPGHTGEMPGPGPDPSAPIDIHWQFSTGFLLTSSPAVVNGVVYTAGFEVPEVAYSHLPPGWN